jgi:hypothetical protein
VKIVGGGLTLYVHEGWDGSNSPVQAIARAVDSLSTRVHINLVPDGAVDGIYVTDVGGRFLVLNGSEKDVEREVQVGIGQRGKVKLPASAITSIE